MEGVCSLDTRREARPEERLPVPRPQHEQRCHLGNNGHSRHLMESKAFSVSLFQMSGTLDPE